MADPWGSMGKFRVKQTKGSWTMRRKDLKFMFKTEPWISGWRTFWRDWSRKTSNYCLNDLNWLPFIQVFGHHSNPVLVWDTLFKGDGGFLNLKCLKPESEQKRPLDCPTLRVHFCSYVWLRQQHLSAKPGMPFWSHKFVWNWLGKILRKFDPS